MPSRPIDLPEHGRPVLVHDLPAMKRLGRAKCGTLINEPEVVMTDDSSCSLPDECIFVIEIALRGRSFLSYSATYQARRYR